MAQRLVTSLGSLFTMQVQAPTIIYNVPLALYSVQFTQYHFNVLSLNVPVLVKKDKIVHSVWLKMPRNRTIIQRGRLLQEHKETSVPISSAMTVYLVDLSSIHVDFMSPTISVSSSAV